MTRAKAREAHLRRFNFAQRQAAWWYAIARGDIITRTRFGQASNESPHVRSHAQRQAAHWSASARKHRERYFAA